MSGKKPDYIANFEVVQDEDGKDFTVFDNLPNYVNKLVNILSKNECDFYRVASRLMIARNDFKNKKTIRVKRIDKASELYSFMGTMGIVSQFKQNQFFSKEEAFAALRDLAPEMDFESGTPHQPKIDGVYYRQFEMVKSEGLVDRLIRLWNPSTEYDHALMKAAIATPFWGGKPGARPAIFITTDMKEGGGRGYGKTELVKVAAELAGGMYSGCNISDVKGLRRRILNSQNMSRRVVLFDNIKKFTVSSGELEDVLTSKEIGGPEALHVGDGSVLNYFTYYFTINGGSYSPDLASRAFIIEIKKACHGLDYDKIFNEICIEKRQQVVFEIINMLKEKRTPHPWHCRFRSWHEDVLERFAPPESAHLLKQRQKDKNAEEGQGEELEEWLNDHLEQYSPPITWMKRSKLDTSKHCFFIPKSMMSKILEQSGIYRPRTTKDATVFLKNLRLPTLFEYRMNNARGWAKVPSADFNPEMGGHLTPKIVRLVTHYSGFSGFGTTEEFLIRDI